MSTFAQQIAEFRLATKLRADAIVGGFVREMHERVVDRSPVGKSLEEDGEKPPGTFRGNWRVGFERDNTEYPIRDENGGQTKAIGAAAAALVEAGDVVYVQNGTSYGPDLEYGLYRPGNGPRTVAGFSTQAPAGVARVTAAEADEILALAVARAPK